MDDACTVEWMTKAITEATRSARFSADGTLPKIDPRLEVDGLGRVTLPLTPKAAKQLIARCKVAPYGKGTKTLINTKGSSHKCVHDSAPAGRPRRGKRVRMRSCQLTSGEVVCRSVDGRLRGPRF